MLSHDAIKAGLELYLENTFVSRLSRVGEIHIFKHIFVYVRDESFRMEYVRNSEISLSSISYVAHTHTERYTDAAFNITSVIRNFKLFHGTILNVKNI